MRFLICLDVLSENMLLFVLKLLICVEAPLVPPPKDELKLAWTDVSAILWRVGGGLDTRLSEDHREMHHAKVVEMRRNVEVRPVLKFQ